MLSGDIHLQKDVLHQAQLVRLGGYRPKQPLRVHRVDEGDPAHHLLHLVGLEVADEVDLRPGVGAGLQMGGELLHPVFPAQADAAGNGGADGLVGLNLGGGAQGDFSRVPARRPGGGGNSLLNGFDVLGQVHDDSFSLYLLYGQPSSSRPSCRPVPWVMTESPARRIFRPEPRGRTT